MDNPIIAGIFIVVVLGGMCRIAEAIDELRRAITTAIYSIKTEMCDE